MRILPYRTLDNNIAGVVVSFVDINRIKEALGYADNIINNVREPVLVLDEKLRVISASHAFYSIFQVKPEETVGQLIYELGDRQWDIPNLRKILKEVQEKNSVFEGYQVEHDFPGIGQRVMLLNARRILDGKGTTQNILLAMEDITGRSGLESFSLKKENQKGES
jgi:PAS domain-containing protein